MNKFRQILTTGKGRCFHLNQYRSTQQKLSEAELDVLPKQDAQISQISSGITVASIENYSPVTYVSVAVKAGSRYENSESLGITHVLRNCGILSTKNRTRFTLTTSLEMLGAKLSVSGTRDHLIYNLECGRDNIDAGLEIFSDIVSNPVFKPWEISEVTENLKKDLAIYAKHPESVLMEALHRAAFRGGLSNSLFAEPFMLGKHNSEMLHRFFHDHYSPTRTSVVGLGLPHDDLQRAVDLMNLSGYSAGGEGASKFAPGEVRIESDMPFVHVGIVAEGASSTNPNEALSFGVLQSLLGLGSHINFTGSQFSKLGEGVEKRVSGPFYVSGLNLNYSGNGLFGVYIVGTPNEMSELVKAVVGQMRNVSKSITDSAVEVAKHKLKAKLMFEQETSQSAIASAILDLSNFGKLRTKGELEKSIDDLKTSDIQSVASKIVKAKPAMAAVGRLHNTPHVDELL